MATANSKAVTDGQKAINKESFEQKIALIREQGKINKELQGHGTIDTLDIREAAHAEKKEINQQKSNLKINEKYQEAAVT